MAASSSGLDIAGMVGNNSGGDMTSSLTSLGGSGGSSVAGMGGIGDLVEGVTSGDPKKMLKGAVKAGLDYVAPGSSAVLGGVTDQVVDGAMDSGSSQSGDKMDSTGADATSALSKNGDVASGFTKSATGEADSIIANSIPATDPNEMREATLTPRK